MYLFEDIDMQELKQEVFQDGFQFLLRFLEFVSKKFSMDLNNCYIELGISIYSHIVHEFYVLQLPKKEYFPTHLIAPNYSLNPYELTAIPVRSFICHIT
jgi:hypothetical protein